MDKFVLTELNFEIYAMKAYMIPCLSTQDFYNDLKKVKYVKRLINRYKTTGILKERLILNHIILLGNVFGPEDATRILFYKLGEDFYSELKTLLTYLNYMPDEVLYISTARIYNCDIPIDMGIAKKLRQI